jgi:hypothetical protein
MDNESVEKLMEILLQMRINMRQISETFQLQTQEIRQQLVAIFERDVKGLADCLNRVDKKLNECSTAIDDYRQRYGALAGMREKMLQLGAEPGTLPPQLPSDQLDGVIAWRLQELQARAKL